MARKELVESGAGRELGVKDFKPRQRVVVSENPQVLGHGKQSLAGQPGQVCYINTRTNGVGVELESGVHVFPPYALTIVT